MWRAQLMCISELPTPRVTPLCESFTARCNEVAAEFVEHAELNSAIIAPRRASCRLRERNKARLQLNGWLFAAAADRNSIVALRVSRSPRLSRRSEVIVAISSFRSSTRCIDCCCAVSHQECLSLERVASQHLASVRLRQTLLRLNTDLDCPVSPLLNQRFHQ